MGVVRDVTVDNLVTAVGNIDTSSLAQDSTLQDVVTAIGNISGGSDPVTNTTVNSLCKDTTGQSIATAISGLGQTLGSDKANIDGSNIADKAAFRNSINVKEIKSINFTGTTDAAGNLLIPTITVSTATPLVAITSNGYAAGFIFSGNNYYIKLIKNGMTELTNTTVSAYVFYI